MFRQSFIIQQGAEEYRDGNVEWVNKFYDDMIRFVNLTDPELKKYAEAIRVLIENNYKQGITNAGDPVAPLASYTIAKKGHARPFLETGLLFSSILKQKIPDGWEIFVAEQRAQIAFNLQYGIHTEGRPMPPRPAFGISPERADTLLASLIREFHYNKV